MALIDCARTLLPGDAYSSVALIGSAGAVYADDHHNMQLLFGGGRPTAIPTRQGDGYLVALLQEFVTALAEKREPSVPGADGLAALQVAEAAAESLATGRALHRAGERYAFEAAS
jgi:predicted dehydrogenase